MNSSLIQFVFDLITLCKVWISDCLLKVEKLKWFQFFILIVSGRNWSDFSCLFWSLPHYADAQKFDFWRFFFFFTFKWEKKSKWVFLKIGLLFCKLRSSMLVGALFNYLFFFSLISSFILVSHALTGSIYCLCLWKCQS